MRKFLILSLFVLILIGLSGICTSYTPPPYYSVNLTLETPYTPPPYYSVNLTLGEGPAIITRNVQQYINYSDKITEIRNINRQTSSEIQTTINFSREQSLTKKEDFIFSLTTFIDRISTLSRKTTQSLTFTGLTERIVFLCRILAQPTTFTEIIERISTQFRELIQLTTWTSYLKKGLEKPVEDLIGLTETTEKTYTGERQSIQPLTFTGLTERISTLSRKITQPFTITELTIKLQNLFKPLTDLIGLTETTEKTYIGDRQLTQTIILTESHIKELQQGRDITISITLTSKTAKGLNLPTYLQLIITPEMARQIGLTRPTELQLTISPELLKAIQIYKETKDTTLLTMELKKQYTGERQSIQPLTFTGLTERISTLSRKITQPFTITELTIKLQNLFKPLTDLIGLTETTEKTVIYLRKPTLILTLSESSVIVLPKIPYNISVYTQEYAPGDEVYIYAMIPKLIINPNITIYYPNMTKFIEDNMNYFEDYIYYYTLTAPNIKGNYLIEITAPNTTAINTFRVSPAYIEGGGGGVGIDIYSTGDYLYYPGTTAKIPFTIISRTNGEPIDYDSIKITIYSPNMTKIAERTTANKISQGIYYINYNISSLADYGVYPIIINTTSGSYYTTRLTSFKVLPAGPLDISITPLKTEVQQGEDLLVKLRIKNLGEGRTITYTYRIYSANNTYYTETSSLTLNRYEDKQLIKTIPLPITADTGIATLELNVSYSPSEPSIYNTNFVTISYSPRGYTPKILTITFNLTPEKQYLTILRNNNTVFSGIIHNKDTMQLSEGKYKFIFSAENYFKKTAEIYLDRDLTITSKLSSTFFQIPVLLAENMYKLILFLLILACIIIFFRIRIQ